MNDEVRVVPTDGFVRDFDGLPMDQRKRVSGRLATLARKGWIASVRGRDVAELGDGIWQLRVIGRGPAYRVIFFLDPRGPGRVVVLTACASKSSIKKAHVMKAEIRRAKVRRAQWLQQEQER